MTGVAAAALLAILLDGIVKLFEESARRRSWFVLMAATIALLIVLAGAMLPVMLNEGRSNTEETVVVGAKTFSEQYILAELISDRLGDVGMTSRNVESLGSTVAFDALAQGNIDVYVDYSGTLWANAMKRGDNPGAEVVLRELKAWLEEEHGVILLGALGFENAYAFAMRREDAGQKGIVTISDLVPYAHEMSIGGDYEFFDRPEWESVRNTYDLNFKQYRRFDSTLMYPAVRDGLVDVIGAFSTDGRIAAYDLTVLEDPLGGLPPYDAVLLLSRDAARQPEIVNALSTLVGKIHDPLMREANRLVDVDGLPVAAAADSLYHWLRTRDEGD
jgi:osmoprotectant transport system permease protein